MPNQIHSAICILACRVSGILSVLFGGMFVGYAISHIANSSATSVSSLVFSVAIGGIMAIAGTTLLSPSSTRRIARRVRDGNLWSQLAHLPLAIGAIASVLAACVIYFQSRGEMFGIDGVLFIALASMGVFFTYSFFSLPRFLSSLLLESRFDDSYEAPSAKSDRAKFSRTT